MNHSDHISFLFTPQGSREQSSMTEHMKWIIVQCQLNAQKETSQLIIMASETKHFRNSFLQSITIEMIPESIVLMRHRPKSTRHLLKPCLNLWLLSLSDHSKKKKHPFLALEEISTINTKCTEMIFNWTTWGMNASLADAKYPACTKTAAGIYNSRHYVTWKSSYLLQIFIL